MARIRSVHPDICQSETMTRLSAELERTFVRLWTHCDDDGRCEDRPTIIKSGIYPDHTDMTPERVDDELWGLHEAGLIIRYEVAGKRYVAVRSWAEYQHPQKARASSFPPPPVTEPSTTPPGQDSTPTVRVREGSRNGKGLELGGGVGDGDGVGDIRAPERPGTALALVPSDSSPTAKVKAQHGYADEFEDWWRLYPRKVAKAGAAKAWKAARRSVDPDTLTSAMLAATRVWQAQGRSPEHIPHAASWLNGRRWEDQPETDMPLPAEPRGFAGIRAALNSNGHLP